MPEASRALVVLSMLAFSACAARGVKVSREAPIAEYAVAAKAAPVVSTDVSPEPAPVDSPPEEVATPSLPSPISEVAYSPDGSRLAIARANWAVSVIDLEESTHLADLRAPGVVGHFVWSNDGHALGIETHNGVLVLGLRAGQASSRVYGNERTARDPRRSMKLAPDLESAARLDESGRVEILSVATGATRRVLDTRADALLCFVPDKPLLALKSPESIDLVNLETGKLRARIFIGTGVLGEPMGDGRFVVIRGRYATRVADLVQGRTVLSTPAESSIAIERKNALVAFSRASHAYMTPPSRVARVYNLETGAVGAELEAERYHQGRLVLSNFVWEERGREVRGVEPMTGRDAQKLVLPEGAQLLDVPSPTGNRFLATKSDGTLLVLDLEGAVVARLDP